MAEETEQKEVSQALPETLVEKIIAMMPFPFIFKARALSESWRDKFSPILSSSSRGAGKSFAAAAFQTQVGQWSTNWKTFSPVLLGEEDLVAYDRAAQSWRRLPSMLSFLQDVPLSLKVPLLIEGGLLYGIAEFNALENDSPHVVVANILTWSWRLLPHRPDYLGSVVQCLKLVVYPSLAMYKVILFCRKDHPADLYCAQIYDSKSGAWRNKDFRVSCDIWGGLHGAAYLNGVLYMVDFITPEYLLAFNVEEETLEELRLSFNSDETLNIAFCNLVICNANWLMIVGPCNERLYRDMPQVFRIDLGSLRLLRLAHGPPAALHLSSVECLQPGGDGNCLFFLKVSQNGTRVVAYNVDEDVWSSFSVPCPVAGGVPVPCPFPFPWSDIHTYLWCQSSFRPGLSSFMAV